MTTGTTIPLLSINIMSPDDGNIFSGQSVINGITVSGTASFVRENAADGTIQDLTSSIDNVEVRLGADLVKIPPKQNSSWANWSATFTSAEILARLDSGGKVTIKAKATAGALTDESVITVTVDNAKPALTIASPNPVNTPSPPYKVTLEGTATDSLAGIDKVEWRVGGVGSFSRSGVSIVGSGWKATDIPLPSALGANTITVKATDKVGNFETKDVVVTVIDGTEPNLSVTSPAKGATVTPVNGKVSLTGTASDSQTAVSLVEWKLDGQAQFTQATPNAPNDWSTWSALIPVSTFGERTVAVRAKDAAGNTKISLVTFEAAVTFEPKDPNDVVSQEVYLDEMLNFASLRVKTAASGPLVSRSLLANTFYQSFDALTALNNRHIADQPVNQARLCVEVLRKVLASRGLQPLATAEADYRRTAYETLLRDLGTSYGELRLLGNDDDRRAALANRLGIAPTPDQLGRLILQPSEITEANLQRLFGLAETRDPFALNATPVIQEPELLTWRLAKLRAIWQQQDDAARSDVGTPAPVIDPDMIGEQDFRTPTPEDRAYGLWQERREWVEDELARIKQLRESKGKGVAIDGFNAIVGDILGPVDEPNKGFITLERKYKAGEDIEPQLRDRQLTLQPFLYLVRIHDLASTGTVLDAEWDDVYSILTQVQKFRQYRVWREEEGTLTLGPDYFQLPPADAPPIELPGWRSTPQARQSWQATLESRIDQKQAMVQALQDSVDAAERATLPALREALMELLRQPKETLDAAANRLTRGGAIDFQSGEGQKTTRIAQAIDTLQTAIFSVRTGRFIGTDPAADWELALGNDYEEADFDEEWQWMGAHGAWRSAMFVFLYPENLLLPTLRKHQTPAFRNLVDALRSSRRLTPQQARAFATAYSEYYRDVCSITPEASCQTETRFSEQDVRTIFYMFGRGKATEGVYWSAYDPLDTSGYAQTFWDIVPGLDGVSKIVGAAPYRISDDDRFIYLFLQGQEKGKQKLFFTRYDLERRVWDAEPVELELPTESGIDTIIIVQTQTETKPPELFLRSSRARYFRSLNDEGSEWQSGNSEVSEQEGSDEWSAFKVKESGYPAGGAPVVKAIHAVLKNANETSSYWLCVAKTDNKLYVEKWSNVFTGRTTVSNPTFSLVANFIGAFQLSTQDEILLFYSSSSGKFYRQIKVNSAGTQKNAISDLERVTPSYGQGIGDQRHIAYRRAGAGGQSGAYRSRFAFDPTTGVLTELGASRVAPSVNGPFEITEQLSETKLQSRKAAIQAVFTANGSELRSNLTYLEEAYYFAPVQLALQLQLQGQYTAALDWFRTVYAYNLPAVQRKIYYGLVSESAVGSQFTRSADWLLNGLNPHAIAAVRANAYTRFTIMSLARCFLDFADAEFTREAPESIARARTLYLAALELLGLAEMQDQTGGSGSAKPPAPNPAPQAIRLRAEVNLFKLRNGLNIAGLERQLEPESQQFATTDGLPALSGDGRQIGAGAVSIQPTPYRYAALIERAKTMVNIAQQIEAAFLSALEKRDAESYTLLKARQDLQMSRAGVRLQDLRVKEAEGGVKLAEVQQQRTQIQVDHFQGLLDAGESPLEKAALDLMFFAAAMQAVEGLAGFILGAGFSGMAQSLLTTSSLLSTLASFERRKEEWQFQLSLAQEDVRIGAQQIKLAEQHARVVGQERFIAEMQAGHAEATVDFLANKFTNRELFDWMSGVLERVYAYFLQQATAMAKLAENQLAYERQERSPAFILSDYWEAPSDGEFGGGADGNVPDRRGLTGSARLLQDIFRLDQHAFETDRRKLQLTKTISLAQLAPVEFQRFRETGVMLFATPMGMFDGDFPGHYLRLIKRVRVSVIALIPPMQGIRATLSTAGASRVVIGEPGFQTVVVNHGPQSVALTSPVNATGQFDLNPDHQPEMLLPFENIGVDAVWEFSLPKAANFFDYSTIGDALLTIEYTALESSTYRRQIIQELSPNISADRPFSFRNQFQDQWYDWHNSDQTATPMTVRFRTDRADFPPNLEDLTIQHIALYFARVDGKAFEVSVNDLGFAEQDNTMTNLGEATSIDGVISTRRGNAVDWMQIIGKSPIGEWELALPNAEEVKNRFDEEEIEDVIFNITYSARLPEWPS